MKNILYEGYLGPRLPREVQLKRVQRVMQEELTPLQRETLITHRKASQTLPPFLRTAEMFWERCCTIHFPAS